jgi:putative ubiquitin-RnfH superfamily antitoxin RatB of RatAB toxin-antitoxin module
METNKAIQIEVAYAREDVQRLISLQVPIGCTVERAIECSGILEMFPEIDLHHQKVGIFSKLKNLSDKVEPGDRIEIYRGLLIDPKDLRRKRAAGK